MAHAPTLSLVIRAHKTVFKQTGVMVRFYVNRQAQYVPTGIVVETEFWDASKGQMRVPPRLTKEEHERRASINKRLADVIKRANDILAYAFAMVAAFTPAYLKDALEPKAEKAKGSSDIIALWAEFIAGAKAGQVLANGKRIRPATTVSYHQALTSLAEWVQMAKFKLSFKSLTKETWQGYVAILLF